MNPENIEYDLRSHEVFITFTDNDANQHLELILFKDETWQLMEMIREKLRYRKQKQ